MTDRMLSEANEEIARLRELAVSLRTVVAHAEGECVEAAHLLKWARKYADHADIGLAIDAHFRKYGRKGES